MITSLSQLDLTKEYPYADYLYEANGVREYWVVAPTEQILQINTLVDGKYVPGRLFTRGDVVSSVVLEDFELDLDDIFEEE
jgi:Uma2 family endonuclease